jgi:hypothetical protein
MMERDRHERQIRLNDCRLGGGWTFDSALNAVMSRHRGLSFFTDEQIAEIRAEMIERQWFRHKLNRENRKRRASQERAA